MIFRSFWVFVAMIASTLATRSVGAAEIIYDNTTHFFTNGVVYSPYEFGDEIFLTNKARIMNTFQFEYYGDFAASSNSTATAVVRFYAMNGTVDSGYPTPGTVLFESAPVAIFSGYNSLTLAGMTVPLSNNVTWTIKFSGSLNDYTVGNRAGLLVYSPPTVGTSYNDYWLKFPSGWHLLTGTMPDGSQAPLSFGARVYAVQDTTMSLGPVIRLQDGSYQLRITGPSGRYILISATSDLANWTPIARVQLGDSALSYVDQSAKTAALRYYRASLIADDPIQVQNVKVLTNGVRSVEAVGPFGVNYAIEASSNLTSWTVVHTNTFTTRAGTFVDTNTPANALRFYRVRLAAGP